MKKVNPGREEQLKTCWATMLKYIGNIAKVSASLPGDHCCACLHLSYTLHSYRAHSWACCFNL